MSAGAAVGGARAADGAASALACGGGWVRRRVEGVRFPRPYTEGAVPVSGRLLLPGPEPCQRGAVTAPTRRHKPAAAAALCGRAVGRPGAAASPGPGPVA